MIIDGSLNIIFKEPVKDDMLILEKWYSMTDSFGHATGLKSFSEISQMLKSSESSNSISFMIHNKKDEPPLGFIYGHIKHLDKTTVLWLRILIVDPLFQNQGVGTRAINKLLNYLKLKYKSLTCVVSVSKNNNKGISFWKKIGFTHSRKLEQSLHEVGTSQVYILKKVIKTSQLSGAK